MKDVKVKQPIPSTFNIYLLIHGILNLLYSVGGIIESEGSEKEGLNALYKFQVSSARLQFGMLVALLNDYDKHSKPREGQSAFLSKRTVKKNEVEIKRFEWKQVALAIEILKTANEVEDQSALDNYYGPVDRYIALTDKGLISFYTEVYKRKAEEETRIKLLDTVAIETGKAAKTTGTATVWLFVATLVIAIATIVTALLPYLNDSEKNDLRIKVQEQQRTIQLLQQRQLPRGTSYSAPEEKAVKPV